METPNLIDAIIGTIGHTIGSSEGLTIIVLAGCAVGFLVIRHQLRGPPRLDLTRHLEHPPVEHQPPRSLPPASKYVDWEAQKDGEKSEVPWRR